MYSFFSNEEPNYILSTALCDLDEKTGSVLNVVLRFFNSRYKVNLMWDSNPWSPDFDSDALQNELASLTQGGYSIVDVYTRIDIEAHKLVPDC